MGGVAAEEGGTEGKEAGGRRGTTLRSKERVCQNKSTHFGWSRGALKAGLRGGQNDGHF